MASLFEALGNLADIPGGMIRNTISGNNPLLPLLDPFGQSGRASGQEVLDAWGAGPDHPLLGFGLEMATDPLTWLGVGMAGKGAKALGLYGKAEESYKAAKAFGKLATKSKRGTQVAISQARKAFSNDLIPALKNLPSQAWDAAYNPDVQKFVGGSLLTRALMSGRSSDDDIVNTYLGNKVN